MPEPSLLDRSTAEPHHLLVLAEDVAPEDVEALAVSRSAEAGWSGPAELQLMPGVHLTGPWALEEDLRRSFDLPAWARRAYLLRCPAQRAAALPPELRGVDPLLDAFPGGVPTGVEAEALGHLRAIARRLRGAVRLAGTGAVVVPDADAAIDLTVLAPVWLDHDAGLQVLGQVLPAVRSALDDIPDDLAGQELEGYMVISDLGDGDLVEIEASGLAEVPIVLRGTDWAAGGVIGYQIRWRPAHPELAYRDRPPLRVRGARTRAADLIEHAAAALQALVGGEIVDDDGFLVDPGDLAG